MELNTAAPGTDETGQGRLVLTNETEITKMATLETYTAITALLVSIEGVLDKNGKPISGVAPKDSLVQLDPEHPATIRWLERGRIKKAPLTKRMQSKGDKQPSKDYGKPKMPSGGGRKK